MKNKKVDQREKFIEFSKNETSFLVPSWDDLQHRTFEISKAIREDNKKIDRVVTLAKGGWPMTRSMVDFLEVKEVASIGVKFYVGINQRLDEPEIYQDLPVSLESEKVLLFDDVADTGESLKFVSDYLMNEKGVASVTTATLYYKPHSSFKPDYYASETDSWIIFPFEVVECLDSLGKKWRGAGMSDKEVRVRLESFGFPQEHIEYFFAESYDNSGEKGEK